MPEYGDVIYNITDMWVATLQSDNTYGTPAQVEYAQDFPIDFESDTDEIKAYGMITETLAILTKATGMLKEASFDMASKSIITGSSESDSGTTPSQVSYTDIEFGGAGLPYFGLIVAGAATIGNIVIGFPKAKLETWPKFNIEQNKFRLGEATINMIAPSTTIRKAVRIRRYETAGSVPTDAAGFDTFFSTPTAMFS